MATVTNGVSFGRQAVRRQVNNRLCSVNDTTEAAAIEIFCECGRRLCADRLQIEVGLYESVLSTAGQYVVTPHHDHDPTQRLVSRHRGFLIVQQEYL
jgi:hypothetical protein